jgi:hypothetical protein
MSLDVLKTISPIERNSVADQVAKKILDPVRTGYLAKPRVDYKFSESSNRVKAEATTSPSLDAADLLGPLQIQSVSAPCESRVPIKHPRKP